MRVKNINGTSDNTCKCGSWLLHWIKFSSSNRIPTCCAEASCINTKQLLGAHVQKDGSDQKWYIIPLCAKHNTQKDAMDVKIGTEFASANTKETCN